ncbi:hypothetical protein GCM10007415_25580 [Parapedobacter pyrenivorans]|uniref:Uncharacterized protein n=1 Tax=Parapedobacter pyrenivorans TaxID=1305674 RepID=A0A917HUU2_9SPHI|nr:hypothetical protein GCM10007415_25580 [Parapedobacter pyrenivorans]
MKQKNASKYFDTNPSGWGLRGDPFLWEDLKSKFQKMNVPVSALELDRLLHKFFKELTGEPPNAATISS